MRQLASEQGSICATLSTVQCICLTAIIRICHLSRHQGETQRHAQRARVHERQTAAGRVAALAVASRIPNVASSIAALRTKVRTTVHTRAQHFTRGRRTDLDYSQRRPAVALYLVRVRVSGQSYQGQDQGLRPRCALAPYRQGARSSRRARHVRHR